MISRGSRARYLQGGHIFGIIPSLYHDVHRILLLFGRNVKFKRGADSLYEVEEISRRGDGKSRVCNKDGVGGRGKSQRMQTQYTISRIPIRGSG